MNALQASSGQSGLTADRHRALDGMTDLRMRSIALIEFRGAWPAGWRTPHRRAGAMRSSDRTTRDRDFDSYGGQRPWNAPQRRPQREFERPERSRVRAAARAKNRARGFKRLSSRIGTSPRRVQGVAEYIPSLQGISTPMILWLAQNAGARANRNDVL